MIEVQHNPVEIAENTFWVGYRDIHAKLHCNPYLLIAGEEAVLFDPGSVLDYEYVVANIQKIIPLSMLKYIVAHHQDPDVISSLPDFQKAGVKATIVTYWRTALMVKYYGVKFNYHITNENRDQLKLNNGKTLHFINTPYLHFPGAIVTYDPDTKVLFSSDLFGAVNEANELYAGQDYVERMKAFHENYMPSNEILRPVMNSLLQLDIEMIAPQHGSIINSDVKKYIVELRELECGAFLTPIKRDLVKSGGYIMICNEVIRRLFSIFSRDEVLSVLKYLPVEINKDSGLIERSDRAGQILWDELFKQLFLHKGVSWLSVMEVFVERIVKQYDIAPPQIFKSELLKTREQVDKLNRAYSNLRKVNQRLEENLKITEEKLIRCPITGLHNEFFFDKFINQEIVSHVEANQNFCILYIHLDHLQEVDLNFGRKVYNETLVKAAYLFDQIREEEYLLFRLSAADFALFVPEIFNSKVVDELAERIRFVTQKTDFFIRRLTVSVSIAFLDELVAHYPIGQLYLKMSYLLKNRLDIAKEKGGDYVCKESDVESLLPLKGKLLIVDSDDLHIQVLKHSFDNAGYDTICAINGDDALNIIETEKLDLVICEMMLPKFNGLVLREKMLESTHLKQIPFVLMSYVKTEEYLKKAQLFSVEYYLKKPFMLQELMGIVKLKIG